MWETLLKSEWRAEADTYNQLGMEWAHEGEKMTMVVPSRSSASVSLSSTIAKGDGIQTEKFKKKIILNKPSPIHSLSDTPVRPRRKETWEIFCGSVNLAKALHLLHRFGINIAT